MSRAQGPSARALALAGGGAAALVASQGFGTAALATLGAGLIALPVLVTALVWAVAAGLEVRRRIAPARLRAGDELTVAPRADRLAGAGRASTACWTSRSTRAWAARRGPRAPGAPGPAGLGRAVGARAATTACRRRGCASPTRSASPAAPGAGGGDDAVW